MVLFLNVWGLTICQSLVKWNDTIKLLFVSKYDITMKTKFDQFMYAFWLFFTIALHIFGFWLEFNR